MYKKTYEIIVGIFVLLAIVALIFMALKVSGLSIGSINSSNYEIKAEFKDIGSLRTGAAVRISGVEIGSVKNIELATSYSGFIATVTLSINNKYNKIPGSYSASIQTSGILGDSFVALEPAKINLPNLYGSEYLKNGSVIPLTNTTSSINLNSLINTFVSSSGTKK
ncbi:outer membrane lipid asymmetry maintenance protein MlaD [Fangia hongkongensis]|uniref:outer membrane lipid asymmetry maintenance protein MlaD n=1 Tax=Fangia hongkongensis TaxID=270495 RepID=UPI000377FE2C|nr:outer membrane lipid asymmetry maintenance protein MlaD [Fangia hongkongensis]MBK2125339.1 outer membrane lipid asymmetry maintenance protein MlaD [Fangia hongkongensis]